MITKQEAVQLQAGTILHHKFLTNADGTPLRVRVNGKCKTWVTRPSEFRLPCKRGIYDYYAIDHNNAVEWDVA